MQPFWNVIHISGETFVSSDKIQLQMRMPAVCGMGFLIKEIRSKTGNGLTAEKGLYAIDSRKNETGQAQRMPRFATHCARTGSRPCRLIRSSRGWCRS